MLKARPNHCEARKFLIALAEEHPDLHRDDANEALTCWFAKNPQHKVAKNQKGDLLTEFYGLARDQSLKVRMAEDWRVLIVNTVHGRMMWPDVPVAKQEPQRQPLMKKRRRVSHAASSSAPAIPQPQVRQFVKHWSSEYGIPFYVPIDGGDAVWELPVSADVCKEA